MGSTNGPSGSTRVASPCGWLVQVGFGRTQTRQDRRKKESEVQPGGITSRRLIDKMESRFPVPGFTIQCCSHSGENLNNN
jgi:hypothetical protein